MPRTRCYFGLLHSAGQIRKRSVFVEFFPSLHFFEHAARCLEIEQFVSELTPTAAIEITFLDVGQAQSATQNNYAKFH